MQLSLEFLFQGKTGGKHNITKNMDLRKTFEEGKGDEKLIHNNPILSAVIKNHLQSYDPRSPTQDFERTPIIIASKVDQLPNNKNNMRIQNENNYGSPCLQNEENEDIYDSCAEANESPDMVVPKNLCNGFFDMTLNDTIKDTDEPLGSSTASNEAIENNISNESSGKPTGFLETNFDYVEANIEEYKDSEDNIQNTDDPDITENINCVLQYEILDDDPRSPSVGIERTPIVVAKTDVAQSNVEEMSDDTLIKVLQKTNSELRHAAAKSLDNPEGPLIYVDEDLNDTPKKTKSSNSSGPRTPLSCMKNKTEGGHIRSKSANTVQDPNAQKAMLSKVARRASHIPRLKSLTKPMVLNPTASSISLKNLTKASAISGDCENTPPHSHRDRWDKDSSIVL